MMETAEIGPLQNAAIAAKRHWALKELPPYRPVVRKLMLLSSTESASLSQVQQVLRTDAAFSADVLRLANSPQFGSRGQITSILQAVMMLGLERIKALATTLTLRAFLNSSDSSGLLRQCWRHNLATAFVCERLARFTHLENEVCYTAGLLHDLGRLALLRNCRDKYKLVLAQAKDNDVDLLRCEKSVFGIDHCEAGAAILDYWGLPNELREVVLQHHQKPLPAASGLLPAVYAAWRLADLLGFATAGAIVTWNIAEVTEALPPKAREHLIEQFDGLAEEVAIKINAVECSLV